MGKQIQDLEMDRYNGGILYKDYSFSGCYYLFAKDEWTSQFKRLKSTPMTGRDARAMGRLLYANVRILNYPDSNLLKGFILNKEKGKIELWDKINWHNYQNGKLKRFEGIVSLKDEKQLQIKLPAGALLILSIPDIPSNIALSNFLTITIAVTQIRGSGAYGYPAGMIGSKLVLPKELQILMSNNRKNTKYFIAKGLEGCIFLYTEEGWNLLENKLKSLPLPRKYKPQSIYSVLKPAYSSHLKEKELVIPTKFLEYAGIKDKVTIINLENRIEIWARESWKQYISTVRNSVMRTFRGKIIKISKNKINIFLKESDKGISLPANILPSGINKGDWVWITISKKLLD